MDMTEEVASTYQSKTQSLRDKMKKRRQAIESLMTGEAVVATDVIKDTTTNVPIKRSKSDTTKIDIGETEDNTVKEVKFLTSQNNISSTATDLHVSSEKTSSKPADDLSALLSMQSAKEREERSQQDEIFSLLSQPTAREQSLLNTFKSVDGGGVKEFCHHSTKIECCKVNNSKIACDKLHFVKILQKHTDESLG